MHSLVNARYFDYPSLGKPNRASLLEISQWITSLNKNITEQGGDYTLSFFDIVEEARNTIADFYHVSPKNICFISNTTEGLGLVASNLKQIQHPINVTLPDIEFISSASVWLDNADTISYIQTEDGEVNIAETALALENAEFLCISSVQEVSGFRFSFQDLLATHQKKETEYWIVDGIQEAGIFSRDLISDQIDAYIAGGHKWLQNPFGLGFMYLSDRLLAALSPPYYGYLNMKEPKNGWIPYLESRSRKLDDLKQMLPDVQAKNFESGGMVHAIGAKMLSDYMKSWEAQGQYQIHQHIFQLQSYFREKIKPIEGIHILGRKNPKHWSSILTITFDNDLEAEKTLFQKLTEQHFKLSLRSINGVGGIRIGFHYDTNLKEVDDLATAIWKICKTF